MTGPTDCNPCYLGLDVGTQGARAVVADEQGHIVVSAEEPFPQVEALLAPGRAEQDAETWWATSVGVLRSVTSQVSPSSILAIAVTSTSGTFVPVDAVGEPLRPALMYNDLRATEETEEVREAGSVLEAKLGYQFQPAFALPKILWLSRHEPETFQRTEKFLHAADFLVAKLTGRIGVSDFSNALKTGYDLMGLRWPEWIETELGLPLEKLPTVVTPGDEVGHISAQAAEETGLWPTTTVMAGATDGTAAFLASGAVSPGDWSSTLGTTLVLRGVSRELVKDPVGRIYCHRHPEGFWLPGGASSVGGECLATLFANEDLSELDVLAEKLLPTRLIVYPLVRRGERLPFVNSSAEGFVAGQATSREELYAAYLEGVAFVERWCFDLFEELGASAGRQLFVTGGGAKSVVWNRLRASVLGRVLTKPEVVEAAFGAAILAASQKSFRSLAEAAKAMVRVASTTDPAPELTNYYDTAYERFRQACWERGYE